MLLFPRENLFPTRRHTALAALRLTIHFRKLHKYHAPSFVQCVVHWKGRLMVHFTEIQFFVQWWVGKSFVRCALDGDEVGRYIQVHSFVLLYTFPSLHCAAGHRRLVGRGRSRPLAAPLTPDPSCLSGKPLVGRRDQKYIFRQNTFNICSGEENKFIYWWWAIHTNQIWKKR